MVKNFLCFLASPMPQRIISLSIHKKITSYHSKQSKGCKSEDPPLRFKSPSLQYQLILLQIFLEFKTRHTYLDRSGCYIPAPPSRAPDSPDRSLRDSAHCTPALSTGNPSRTPGEPTNNKHCLTHEYCLIYCYRFVEQPRK